MVVMVVMCNNDYMLDNVWNGAVVCSSFEWGLVSCQIVQWLKSVCLWELLKHCGVSGYEYL